VVCSTLIDAHIGCFFPVPFTLYSHRSSWYPWIQRVPLCCIIKLVIWSLNSLGIKCVHMGDFPKLLNRSHIKKKYLSIYITTIKQKHKCHKVFFSISHVYLLNNCSFNTIISMVLLIAESSRDHTNPGKIETLINCIKLQVAISPLYKKWYVS